MVSIPEISKLTSIEKVKDDHILSPAVKIPQVPLQRSCLLAPRVKYGKALVRSPGVIDGQARAHVRIDHVGIPLVTSLPPRAC